MPYSIRWYIQDEIVFQRVWGKATADEHRQMLSELNQVVESSPRQLVHIISDVAGVTESIPIKDVVAIQRENGSADNVGWVIILGEKSPLVKMGAAIGTSIFKVRTRFFDSMDEVEPFLRQMDTTISWDKVDNTVLDS